MADALIADAIPAGTAYVEGSLSCVAKGSTHLDFCNFETPAANPPRGRILAQADFAADLGATDAATASHELVISFDVTIDDPDVVQVFENQGTLECNCGGNGPTVVVSDDPTQDGDDDPTVVEVVSPVPMVVPAMTRGGLYLLILLTGLLGLALVRRRNRA